MVGFGNDYGPSWRWEITWANGDPFDRRVYVSSGLSVLRGFGMYLIVDVFVRYHGYDR